jgi:Pyruvate/2-oxoacid:ferredoxin oxidoreductase delta subunit
MDYRETTLYFYTGTGNSYRVTAWMADAARDAGATVTVRPIESARPSEEIGMGETALLGLVMPTHGFTAPWTVLRFALHLPRRSHTHAIVVATRAGSRMGPVYTPGFEGTATLLIALILALKGYRIRGVTGIDMPTNWIAVHPSLRPDTIAGIVARARHKVAAFTGIILSGKRHFASWIVFLLGLLILPVSLGYLLIGRFFLAKLFFASDRCNGCGLCAEYCPNHAIKMRGSGSGSRPYWTLHCESCMRCMAYCPSQAVEASHLLGVGVCLLADAIPTTALLAWLVSHVPASAFLSRMPDWLLESVYILGVLGLVYPLFHFVQKIGWANRFFTLATLTHYYRRYHEPETTLKDLE